MTPFFNKTFGSNQNIRFADPLMVTANTANYCYYKAEAVTVGDDTYYKLGIYNAAGNLYDGWDANHTYLNLANGEVIFCGEAAGTQYGTDMQNGGLWTIEHTEDGFTFKSAATKESKNYYIGTMSANQSESAVYFKCYSKDTYDLNNESSAKEFTTISDLENNTFYLVTTVDDAEAALYFNASLSGNQNSRFGDPFALATSSANFTQMHLTPVTISETTYYKIGVYNMDNSIYTGWTENNAYLNCQPNGGVVFVGTSANNMNNGYGQDVAKGGLWTVTRTATGFTFKNAQGGEIYLGNNGSTSGTAVEFKAYSKVSYNETTSEAKEFTTVNELRANLFMLTADNDAKMLYFQDAGAYPNNNQDMKSGNPYDVVACKPALYYKAEPVVVSANTYYRIKVYNADGSTYAYGLWGAPYVNLGMYGGIFLGYGTSDHNYGHDYTNGALWEIAYVTDQGFTFRSVAQRDSKNWYMNDNSQSENAVYLKAYSRYSFADYQRTTTVDKYLTLCLPYDATVSGATVYQVASVDNKENPSKLYIEEVAGGNIAAGKAYILKATATTVTATKSVTPNTVTTPSHLNGLTGVFKPTKATADTYVLSNGSWMKVVTDDEPRINATRAYLDLSKATEGAPAGARVMSFTFGNETTALTQVNDNQDGWPVVGDNGVPVQTFRKPDVGTSYPREALPTNDNFRSYPLGMQWQWNHNPDNGAWSLFERLGWLRLKANNSADDLMHARNTLTQRIFADSNKPTNGTVCMDISQMKEGDVAGIAIIQDPYAAIAVTLKDGQYKLVWQQDTLRSVANFKPATRNVALDEQPQRLYFRAQMSYATGKCRFYYSYDNLTWKAVGHETQLSYNLSIFVGARFGIFCYHDAAAATNEDTGYVDVDWFSTEDSFDESIYFPEDYSGYNADMLTAVSISTPDELELMIGNGQLIDLTATFADGHTENIAASAKITSNSECVTVASGIAIGHDEGTATLTATYTDPMGNILTTQFPVRSTYFPFSASEITMNLFGDTNKYDETTHTFTPSQYGQLGWVYGSGADMSKYKYLVVKLKKKQNCGANLNIFPENSIWGDCYTTSIGTRTQVVVKLQSVKLTGGANKGKPLDPSHIYIVSLWGNGGGSIVVDNMYLTNNDDYSPNTTAIDDTVAEESVAGPEQVFDLQGRHVDSAQTRRGLYIVKSASGHTAIKKFFK